MAFVFFKVFVAGSDELFRQLVSNCVFYIHKLYNSFIYIIDRRSLYRIEHKILNTHPKYLPINLQSPATKFSLLLISFYR